MKQMKTTNAVMILIFLILLWFCFLLGGCEKVTIPAPPEQLPVTSQPLTPTPILENTPTPTPQIPVDIYPVLTWNKPEWTTYLVKSIKSDFGVISKAKDLPELYPGYEKLNDEQKVNVIAELLVQVMKYESNWKPDCYYVESTMGIDPITGRQVASEGLFQLSYQDQKNYIKYFDCGFDWSKDKLLKNNDPKKTIFDPEKNIKCGVKILARQVEKYGSITISKGAYWSTLKIDGRHSKIDKIKVSLKGLKL